MSRQTIPELPETPLSADQLDGLEVLADNLQHSAYAADRNKAPYMFGAVARLRHLEALLGRAREIAREQRDPEGEVCVVGPGGVEPRSVVEGLYVQEIERLHEALGVGDG